EALLILGVPGVLAELGLDRAMTAARRQLRVSTGLAGPASGPGQPGPLVHCDLPRWFRSQEPVPQLLTLAEALRRGRQAELRYERPGAPPVPGGRGPAPRVVTPLGLVNKAGTWYLVARTSGERVAVFRAGRITAARVLPAPAARPAGFELGEFWQRWSREFAATRPRLPVRLRASPPALAAFGEVFGDEVQQAISEAGPPDERGWQELTLTFEHELAAAHRLAGFGDQVQVLSPPAVTERLLAVARGILARYGLEPGDAAEPGDSPEPDFTTRAGDVPPPDSTQPGNVPP
ncbi:MAG: WYL domain-containing protein, partial [Actinobacteria bacterium]|nr:WYL domain-containing protein [Actinomycetota bacterium]